MSPVAARPDTLDDLSAQASLPAPPPGHDPRTTGPSTDGTDGTDGTEEPRPALDRRPRGSTAGTVSCDADRGSVTVEYAILLIAVAGFAGLLLLILSGDDVRAMLAGIVDRALQL